MNYPITRHLTVEDKDLLWKFRFYLTSNQRALTKFLRCVDWSNSQEAKQATELINQWQPIGSMYFISVGVFSGYFLFLNFVAFRFCPFSKGIFE